ncbi:hypothetical protein [Aureimonas mangrovi]|uniref:hypothetical protein n=1 Tax=Aureimonas mangrovi TaxID=2758041 RepID=UPI00163D5849|nr:hypothetical protein [Aureimonas mangrovi]
MIETLGEAWSAGWRLKVACAWGTRDGLKSVRECGRRHDVDLETLIWTRGRDFPLSLLQERLRCPTCGSRRVRVGFVVPDNPAEAAVRSVGSARRGA